MITGSFTEIDSALDTIGNVETYLPAAAQSTLTHLRGTAKAHTTPDGVPWAPTVDGEPALNNAANEISVRVAGQTVIVQLEGNSTWWHYGVRGVKPRPVIPVDIVGEKLGNAIARGVAKPFRKEAGA